MSNEALAYKHLSGYASYMEPGYLIPPHVIKLCAYLEAVEAGLIKRLIITMPPRHSKTFNIGEFFPAWFLGRNPNKSVIYATYGQDLANDVGAKVRNIIADSKHRKVFPNCLLSKDTKAKKAFTTRKKGSYYAVGRGGIVTGRGGDILIGDDLLKDHAEAASETVKKGLIDWYKTTFSTRQQDENSAIILMGTRWSVGDLIGWALKENKHENWTVLEMPAWSDEYDALWPGRFPRKRLESIKKTLGLYFWNALYMGRPSQHQGNIFKRDKWGYWRERPKQFDKMVQSWDMNFKEGAKNSYVCGQIWGKIKDDYYLLDSWRKQCGFVETVNAVIKMSKRWPNAVTKYIEDKANGPAVMNILKNRIGGFHPVEPKGSKRARAEAMSTIQDDGNIIIPHPSVLSWAEDFIEENANFTGADGEVNDQTDCMTQAINEMNTTGGIANLEKFLQW